MFLSSAKAAVEESVTIEGHNFTLHAAYYVSRFLSHVLSGLRTASSWIYIGYIP